MSEQDKTLKVDGTEVRVKSDNQAKRRAEFRCQDCNTPFPSYLDLEAHQKIDHIKKAASA